MDLPERIELPVPLTEFTDIIDVRSPSEFAEDHIPGAINLPVLDDEERQEIGTLNAQNPYQSRRLGATLITKNMRMLVADRVERSLNAVLGRGGGLVAMLLGLVITISVQSSSITTSILIPLSAAGVLSLRNVYPVTLGANVGTTITALLAALAASRPEALTVAFVHTIFNISGILLLYPIPTLREIPPRAAETLANVAVERPSAAVAYVFGLFVIIPLIGVAVLR